MLNKLTLFKRKFFPFTQRVNLWMILGPLLLIVSLALAVLKFSFALSGLFFLVALGFLLSWKWKLKGAIGAILCTAAWLSSSFSQDALWSLSLGGSLSVSFLILALCFSEISAFFHSKQTEITNLDEMTTHLQKQLKETQLFVVQEKKEISKQVEILQTELQSKQTDFESLKQLLDVHQEEMQRLQTLQETWRDETLIKSRAITNLRIALDEMKEKCEELKAIDGQQERERELLDQLNEARVDKFQLGLLKEAADEKNQNKELQLHNLKEELQRISEQLTMATAHEFWKELTPSREEDLHSKPQMEKIYNQLKTQFQEKSEVLNQTRKELFIVEGKLITLQKECEQNALELNPDDALLIQHLKETEDECKHLETHVELLQDLVSELIIKKKKPTRAKRTKSKAVLELDF